MRIYNGRGEHRPIAAMEILRADGFLGNVLPCSRDKRSDRREHRKENFPFAVRGNDGGNKERV